MVKSYESIKLKIDCMLKQRNSTNIYILQMYYTFNRFYWNDYTFIPIKDCLMLSDYNKYSTSLQLFWVKMFFYSLFCQINNVQNYFSIKFIC